MAIEHYSFNTERKILKNQVTVLKHENEQLKKEVETLKKAETKKK